MFDHRHWTCCVLAMTLCLVGTSPAWADDSANAVDSKNALNRNDAGYPAPPLVEGVTLDEVLDAAAKSAPDSWPDPIKDNAVYSFTLFELFEYRVSDTGRDQIGWDTQGWIGNDDHKFWWKAEGDAILDGADEGDADLQALYAKPISAFWYLQAGLRYEQSWEPGSTDERFSAALGVQGFAPYKFDVEPTVYLTDDGDVLAQFTASYDLYLTQRIVLQPRVEINASAQDVPESGLGTGINNIDLDLRLRYEIQREFAPYVGIRYGRLTGGTAGIARRSGGDDNDLFWLFGVRIAF
jgi:copper resistance protein B